MAHGMIGFITRRVLHGILILIGVSLITFFLINQSPGNYLDKMRLDPQIPRQWIEEEEKRLGLDKPWFVTYLLWMKGIVTELNFGKSFEYKSPVFEVMKSRTLNTLLLSFTSMMFSWLLALPLGIIAG